MVKLLQSAGLAVKALTHTSARPEEMETPVPLSIEQQKESFTTATSQYFSLLSSLGIRLQRQIKALGEAQIIPKEATSTATLRDKPTAPAAPSLGPNIGTIPNTPLSKQSGSHKGSITGGGLGGLDIGWLNSRNDNVGKAKEAELWEEALRSVQRLEEEKTSSKADEAFSREDITMTEHSSHA